MGSIRFRRSKKIGPFRLNITKTGVGLSAGVPGARVSVHSSGRFTRTVGIPGTGIYYRDDKVMSHRSSPTHSAATSTSGPRLRLVPVVGTSHHQSTLLKMAAMYPQAIYRDGQDEPTRLGFVLMAEPENPYDANAVAVYGGEGHVGYLSKTEAPVFQSMVLANGGRLDCPGHLVGGTADKPTVGVRLDLPTPTSAAPVPPTLPTAWSPDSDQRGQQSNFDGKAWTDQLVIPGSPRAKQQNKRYSRRTRNLGLVIVVVVILALIAGINAMVHQSVGNSTTDTTEAPVTVSPVGVTVPAPPDAAFRAQFCPKLASVDGQVQALRASLITDPASFATVRTQAQALVPVIAELGADEQQVADGTVDSSTNNRLSAGAEVLKTTSDLLNTMLRASPLDSRSLAVDLDLIQVNGSC